MTDAEESIGRARQDAQTGSEKGNISPTDCALSVQGNVWEWIHEIAATSPVQPVANLGTGFVDYNPPGFIVEAHKKALNEVEGNQYAPITGLSSLRNAVSKVWSPYYGRELDSETEICICNGAQEALLSSVTAFVRPGDEVVLFEPVFELYVYQLKLAGAVAIYVPLRPPQGAPTEILSGNDWTLDMAELEKAISPRTKAIILNHPHNPLGKVFTPKELLAIGNICISHDLLLISDEVYERIAFGSSFTRTASIDPAIAARTLTTISLGKLFNATGWRVGFVIGSPKLVQYVQAMHALLAYASSSPAQEAFAIGLIEAEHNGFWEKNRQDVGARVMRICNVLEEIGLPYVKPLGAYFLFVDISKVNIPCDYKFPEVVNKRGSKDWRVCFYLVNEIGISSIPGSCFYGSHNARHGESYVRFGVCKSEESLALAENRLRQLKPIIG